MYTLEYISRMTGQVVTLTKCPLAFIEYWVKYHNLTYYVLIAPKSNGMV